MSKTVYLILKKDTVINKVLLIKYIGELSKKEIRDSITAAT